MTLFQMHKETFIKGMLGSAASFGTVAIDSVLHSWLTILALIGGIVVSVLTAWSILSKRRKTEIEIFHEMIKLCRDCAKGNPPPTCPLPRDVRPMDCPLLKK